MCFANLFFFSLPYELEVTLVHLTLSIHYCILINTLTINLGQPCVERRQFKRKSLRQVYCYVCGSRNSVITTVPIDHGIRLKVSL